MATARNNDTSPGPESEKYRFAWKGSLAMIHSGQIAAQRVGRSWVIEQAEVNQRLANRRPLSSRMAGPHVNAMSGKEPSVLDAQERFFLGKYIKAADLDEFLRDNLLIESATPNIRLHIVRDRPSEPVLLGLVIADLVDWNRLRARTFEGYRMAPLTLPAMTAKRHASWRGIVAVAKRVRDGFPVQ